MALPADKHCLLRQNASEVNGSETRFGQDKMKQRDGRELNVQSEEKRVCLHC